MAERLKGPTSSPGFAMLRALRIRQWVKNVLVLVPAVLDHRLAEPSVMLNALIAFASVSLAASGGYVVNDLLDIEADRNHETKRLRPFAAGAISPVAGWALVLVLTTTAVGLAAATLPTSFLGLLLLYLVLTLAYSLYLKVVPVVDVMLLAGLYTLRILAGVAATGVRFSAWLLAFSMFLFLSLAFMKRFGEIYGSVGGTGAAVPRRGYVGTDLDWLRSMGGASGYLAVLVLALYINSEEVTAL
jgi:4-hydroxybenzoate polyprenyltransferase